MILDLFVDSSSAAPPFERPSLREQADEVELSCLGLRDLIDRAEAKQIRRTPTDIARYRQRLTVAQAAFATLRGLAMGEEREGPAA